MSDLNINKDTEPRTDSSVVSENSSEDLVAVVDELLNQLSTKFTTVSSDLISKMDEMSRRLDNLEATISASSTRPENDESR